MKVKLHKIGAKSADFVPTKAGFKHQAVKESTQKEYE